MSIAIDLGGRAAFVTGGGAGIGREIARWLADAGAAVVVNDIDPGRADETGALLRASGATATAFPGDMRDPSVVEDAIAFVVETHGRIDIAVNNVGMTAGRAARPVVRGSVDDAWAVIDQNLHTAYACCRREAIAMIDQEGGGVILNVTSGETTRPAVGLASYGAAKAAVNHLTMTLAAELGPHGIRVNSIAPGTTYTEVVQRALGPEQFEAISRSTPLQRVCEPDELGRLAVFLCSELARCITGQCILADAGAHLGRLPLTPPEPR